jgi:hypothetical protein
LIGIAKAASEPSNVLRNGNTLRNLHASKARQKASPESSAQRVVRLLKGSALPGSTLGDNG